MTFWFIVNFLILIGSLNGNIRFGLGLGDLIYVGIVGGITLLVGIYYLIYRKKSSDSSHLTKSDVIVMMFCLSFTLYIILKMTYLREIMSKWDGQVFF